MFSTKKTRQVLKTCRVWSKLKTDYGIVSFGQNEAKDRFTIFAIKILPFC